MNRKTGEGKSGNLNEREGSRRDEASHENSTGPAAALTAGFPALAVPPTVDAQEERNDKVKQTTISLTEASFKGMPFEQALEERRSIRTFSDRNMTEAELSQLLFSGQGITGRTGGRNLRAVPSAGATYPMELYAVVNSVEGIDSGIYRYVPDSHELILLKKGDFGGPFRGACLGQTWLETASVNLIITAVPDRISGRYGDRSPRYILFEAGHIAQNILLQAVSLGLGAVPIGACRDEEVNAIMSLDGITEQTVYIITVGTR